MSTKGTAVHPADHYTIQWSRDGKHWENWSFFKGAKVATWKKEATCENYMKGLEKANPDVKFRVTFWPGFFSIPAR